jgi:hypothetical protein
LVRDHPALELGAHSLAYLLKVLLEEVISLRI